MIERPFSDHEPGRNLNLKLKGNDGDGRLRLTTPPLATDKTWTMHCLLSMFYSSHGT